MGYPFGRCLRLGFVMHICIHVVFHQERPWPEKPQKIHEGEVGQTRPVGGRMARKGQTCKHAMATCGDCRGLHFAQANVCPGPKKREAL